MLILKGLLYSSLLGTTHSEDETGKKKFMQAYGMK